MQPKKHTNYFLTEKLDFWMRFWVSVAHTSEGFFGLEDEPVKSVKMKVETGPGYFRGFHISALCSLQFRFALVSVVFSCVVWNPIRKKTLNQQTCGTKSTRIALSLIRVSKLRSVTV